MNTINKILAAIALSSLVSAPALAQSVNYSIDPTHTFPQFSYDHMGLSKQTLRFNKTTGTVSLDAKAQKASVNIEIDMKSVDTGFVMFDGHIQGEDFLNTEKYPTATFKSTNVIFADGKPSKVEGDLTIKDVTKPVVLDITHFVNTSHPMLNKDSIGANATTVIKRSEFNADAYTPGVGDEVTINVSLEAVAE